MQKNIWNTKLDWVKSGSTSPYIYYQKNRANKYNENMFISVGDIYFKLNKYLTGVTFTYVNSLNDIYNIENYMTGDGHSLVNMYNEYDVIDRVMKNIIFVDVAADINIDTDYQLFEINGVKLKPGHLVLLKNQTNQEENNIYYVDDQYFLWLTDHLSTREKSNKFSCSIKLGKNADKQFFLANNGDDFPTTDEPKYFIEGKSYILKNLIQYNLFNTRTGSTYTSKIIFTDYNLARTQLSENYGLYDETTVTGLTLIDIPYNYFTVNYHYDSYTIRSGSTSGGTFSGNVTDFSNFYSGYTSLLMPSSKDFIVGDYIYINMYSGNTVFSGKTHLEMWQFIKEIKSISGNSYIILEETIPTYILRDLQDCSYFIENLKVATDWYDAIEKFNEYTPYSDFYSVFEYSYVEFGVSFIDIVISPKENNYYKYFDYDALSFGVTDSYVLSSGTTDLYSFETSNQYIKYKLYDRLSAISTGFTSGFTIHNEEIISGSSISSYKYIDDLRIKVTTNTTGLTNIFKPYTYIYATSMSGATTRTLVYSVSDHEIIFERPVGWISYKGNFEYLGQITSIQNIDGLQNISDILYTVYINENHEWYRKKSDNERKYISRAYADLLVNNEFFRINITGILYENENNEFILKLYNLDNDTNLTQFKTIEMIYIGSDRKSRLPVPLRLIETSSGDTTSLYSYEWTIMDGGVDDSLDGTDVLGDVFAGGLNSILPGNCNPTLIYTNVDGGLDSV